METMSSVTKAESLQSGAILKIHFFTFVFLIWAQFFQSDIFALRRKNFRDEKVEVLIVAFSYTCS